MRGLAFAVAAACLAALAAPAAAKDVPDPKSQWYMSTRTPGDARDFERWFREKGESLCGWWCLIVGSTPCLSPVCHRHTCPFKCAGVLHCPVCRAPTTCLCAHGAPLLVLEGVALGSGRHAPRRWPRVLGRVSLPPCAGESRLPRPVRVHCMHTRTAPRHIHATPATTVDPPLRTLASLFSSVIRAGGYLHPNVHMDMNWKGDVGLVADGDVDPGAVVVATPDTMFLCTTDVKTGRTSEAFTHPPPEDATPSQLLVGRLLQEVSRAAHSKWYPYINMLPSKVPVPSYYDESAQTVLGGAKVTFKVVRCCTLRCGPCLPPSLTHTSPTGLGAARRYFDAALSAGRLGDAAPVWVPQHHVGALRHFQPRLQSRKLVQRAESPLRAAGPRVPGAGCGFHQPRPHRRRRLHSLDEAAARRQDGRATLVHIRNVGQNAVFARGGTRVRIRRG